MSHCLSYIKSDPRAVDIFHPRHIANTDRLKNGYETYKRRCAQHNNPPMMT
jgi:hypothetical protein